LKLSEDIYKYISSQFGEQAALKYEEFIVSEPKKFIRVNQLKTTASALQSKLKNSYGISAGIIPELPNALIILEDKDSIVGKTIEHISGLYYIQSLSSMLPPLVLNPAENDIVLDMCAAPGSKTTELGELMHNHGTLISNEIQNDRVRMLVYNIERMNLVNTGILHYKGELLSKIYADYFDKILVDAPCSGLGIIQKKGEVSNWWSKDRAERLGELQFKLLTAAVKMVRPGGEIVYSTCTLTVEENEMVLDKLLGKYPVEVMEIDLPFKSNDGIVSYTGVNLNPSLKKARRILPWEVNSEGFFLIKLKKNGKTTPPDQIVSRKQEIRFLNPESKELVHKLDKLSAIFGITAETFSKYQYYFKKNDIYFAVKEWQDVNPGMFERIGTKLGTLDRNNEIVLHTNAAQILSDSISSSIYYLENQNELKIYLEGGSIKKDIGKYGQYVIKYNELLLGTAVISKDGIKSRFPRSKRTQEIQKEF
jgi:16S rRNA (cytosine1407-C5)-methyltransferase